MTPLPREFGAKLGAWDPVNGWSPIHWSDTYAAESISGVSRLLVAPRQPLSFVVDALALYGNSFKLVYLLVTPPDGYEFARYELDALNREEVSSVLEEFGGFLGGDARHHIWIHALDGGGTLIWDEHDWVYLYGHLASATDLLQSKGFREGKPEIPFPHLHNEDPDQTSEMERLLKALPWVKTPVSNPQ
jgi:hypothetical protein